MEFINLIKELTGKKIFKGILLLIAFSLIVYHFSLIKNGMIFIVGEYPLSILGAVLIAALILLMKYSDNQSNRLVKESLDRHYKPFKISTNAVNNVYFTLVDNDKIENNYYITVQIVNNNELSAINKITGTISVYSRDPEVSAKRVLYKSFSVQNLKSRTSYRIDAFPVSRDLFNWSYFEIEIIDLSFKDETSFKDIKLQSKRIIKNTAWILNHLSLYDYKLGFIPTKYNLKWLKDKIRSIKNFIYFLCSRNVYYFSYPDDPQQQKSIIQSLRKDFIRKWFFRLLFGTMIIISCFIIGISIIQLLNLIIVFLQKLGEFISIHIMKV